MPAPPTANTAVALAHFDSEEEAKNFERYAQSKLFEHTLRMAVAGREKAAGSFVPDLGDYRESNLLFTADRHLPEDHEYFGLTLDQCLYKHFKLPQEEIELLEIDA